jgi:V8-like Glu-specific endopeptidase
MERKNMSEPFNVAKLTSRVFMMLAVLLVVAGCQTTRNGYFSNVDMLNGDTYSGYFLDGVKSGRGTYTFANGNKYIGSFRHDIFNGQGTLQENNGNKFVGEYRDNRPNGHGTHFMANGDKYVGTVSNGYYIGQGTYTRANGYKYVGEFRDNQPNGRGTETLADGSKYVGNYSNGKLNGQGTYISASGDRYVGHFSNGNHNGQGTLTLANGYEYVGEWKDGMPHKGTATYPDESKYVGEYRDAKEHGRGTFYYLADDQFKNDKYVGEWKDGKPHGRGRYTFANGDKYVGEFKGAPYSSDGAGFADRNFHGKGTLTYANGKVKEGVWENGKFLDTQQSPPSAVAIKPPEPSPKSVTSGSGFFVSKFGHIVTNQHVVNKCRRITVGGKAKTQVSAEILDTDKRNDLALLKLLSTEMASANTKSLIRKLGIKIAARNVPLSSNGLLRSEDVELGERVLVSGYPYGEFFSDTIKVTGGLVSATRGMGDDRGQFQIDAAVQAGNSGGPIYDAKGNIVGVVISQLNKLKVAKATGSLPENVNFGIKASTVRQFLTSSGLPTKWSHQTKSLSSREIAKIAKTQTLMVVCHK